MPKLIDLIGRRVGLYTVLRRDEERISRIDTYWICKCDCGTVKSIGGKSLRRGHSQSCGCRSRGKPAHNRTHNLSRDRYFLMWQSIMQRCYNPNNKQYSEYGGRGITVCDRWHDPVSFVSDIGKKPTPKHSLDRIDNDGPYSPENTRWATMTQQVRNRRLTLRLDGIPVAELCERHGLKYSRVRYGVACGRIKTVADLRALTQEQPK